MKSRLNVLPKMFKCSIRVWNNGDDFNIPRSNRWRHLLCWRNAFSASDLGRTVTDFGIFLGRFFAFYCVKCHLGSFSRCKIAFFTQYYPPSPTKHAKQDQIHAKWLEKFVFWRESRRASRSLIIINKSIKKKQKIWFFQCKIEFYFTHEHQNLYFHSWKDCFWCSFGEIKLDLTLKISKSTMYWHKYRCSHCTRYRAISVLWYCHLRFVNICVVET